MKFKKSISLLLTAIMVTGCATFAASSAEMDSDSVGYSNQSYLETEAGSASATNDFGATYSAASTTWKTWSPAATQVKLKLYSKGSDAEVGAAVLGEHDMTMDSAGIWSVTLQGDYKNVYYTYLVTVNGKTNETQDVYSKAVGVNGARSMVVDLDSTDPDGWSSDKHVFQSTQTESVVWEVHVRDFSISANSGVSEENKGKYLAFAEGGTTLNGTPGEMSTCIDYLVEKGINTVQLQPVYDFGSVREDLPSSSSNRNWGYDPVNYNVPEGSYSSNPYDGNVRIKEFKQMVQAFHDRGITVVMDVVYNHTYSSDGSCFGKTVPGYYFRMTSSTAYSNGSGCGNETASDKKMFRKYMIDSCKYWADEYHIDGFRFDLMALHDITTMNSIRSALDGMYSDNSGQKILMYGEPWSGGTSQCPSPCTQSSASSLSERVGMFNDTYRDGIKGSTDGADGNFIQGSETDTNKIVAGVKGKSFSAKAPSQTIAYADAHDNLILWDKLCKSNSVTNYTGTNTNVQNQLIGAMTLLLTSKGIPFMTAGSEMGRTKKGDSNSYKSSDDINQIDWSRAKSMPALPQWYKTLLSVRKNLTLMKSNSFTTNSTLTWPSSYGHVVAYTYNNSASGEWNKVCVLYNNDTKGWTISNLGASSWTVVANSVSGTSISATGADINGIATLNSSSVFVPAKGSIVLINGFSNRTVTDSFGTLVVNHVTESGTVLKTQNAKYRAGNTFRAIPDSTILFSRTLKSTTGATSGTVAANSTNTVTFTYSDSAVAEGYLTVKYVDSSNKSIKDSTTLHLKAGDSYSETAPAIQGYELYTDNYPAETIGTFGGTDKTITFKYKTIGTSSTVHYYNSSGASSIYMYAYNDSGEIFGKWDSVTSNSSAKLVADTQLGGSWMKGTIPAGSAYVIFRMGTVQEPGQGESGYLVSGETWIKNKAATFTSTVKTSHINVNTGQKISADVVTTSENVSSSAQYSTSALAGRTDVIAPSNASGSYAPGVINVVYLYTDGSVPISTEPTESTEPSSVVKRTILLGDVNLDGVLTVKDVTQLQRAIVSLVTLTGDALLAADTDQNGAINIKDATNIQLYLAEYENHAQAGEYIEVGEDPTTEPPTTQPPTTQPEPTTTQPEPSTVPEPETKNYQFTNNFNWGSVYCYAWDSEGTYLIGAWPGSKMTDAGTNDYGEKICTIDIPTNAAYVIFSNGSGTQTVDIPFDSSVHGWYLTGTWTNGKADAASW